MITFNHENFIGQAIDSVFSQITDFEFELVIGEDLSTDNTAKVISKYADKYPGRLRVRYNPSNLGGNPNFIKTIGECRGKYIALLEGDDYWTDPLKLKKQITFLENNPSFAMCFHPVQVLEGDKLCEDRFTQPRPEVTDIMDLAKGNYMHTCSVVYRTGLFEYFPETFKSSPVGDYFLHMLNAQYGKIKRLSEVMAVYRVHSGGIWSSHKNLDDKILTYLECMIGCFSPEVNQHLIERHNAISMRSLINHMDASDREARFTRCLKYGSGYFIGQLENIVKDNKKMRSGIWGLIKNKLKKAKLV